MSDLTPLSRLMAQRKITQTALAKAIGVSRQAVQRWQAGETISTVNLRALSGFLKVSPAFLLGEETEVDDAGASPTGSVRRICELDLKFFQNGTYKNKSSV